MRMFYRSDGNADPASCCPGQIGCRPKQSRRYLLFLGVFLLLFLLPSRPRAGEEGRETGEVGAERTAGENEGTGGESEEEPSYTSMRRMTLNYFSTLSLLQLYADFQDPEEVQRFEETWEEVLEILEELDGAVSLSSQESDLSRFSRAEPGEAVPVCASTEALLGIAREAYEATEGLYDPTVFPLVDLFGFTPRFSVSHKPLLGYDRSWMGNTLPLPEEETVQALLPLVDFGSLEWRDGVLYKHREDVLLSGSSYSQSLDLGGLAKGYAVDRVMELLKQKGYTYGYFSCGGSSIGILSRATASKGAPEKAQWGISIQKPRFSENKEDALRLFTRNTMLSTSGDYEHCYTIGQVRYCHLIDPAAGWPINMPADGPQRGICSMTVLGEDAALCDALSTALCVMGPEEAIAFLNREEYLPLSYVMILFSGDRDFCEVVTDLPASHYVILDEDHYKSASVLNGDGSVRYTGTLIP